jgi:trehalose 6-phosphate synthase
MRTSRQSRLITVSNRVAVPQGDAAAAGGLAVGVLAALEEYGGIWFGWNGQLTTGEPRDPEITRHGNIEFATIDLNERDYEQYYNGFSNRVLWPICHYLLGFLQYHSSDFEAYCRVNALFARKLMALLEPQDVIWVHDYHLIPLASELRRAGIENRIGFFLHVPFPSYDVFRAAPAHEYLLRSLCAYDVVGFQTDRDLMSFKACVTQPAIGAVVAADNIMEVAGGDFIADVFPIGIDVDKIAVLAEQAQSSQNVQRMVNSLDSRNLVIGVDRLYYSKGLTQRFLSYERLLEKYPHSRQSLVYIQIAPPTRTGVRAYDDIRAELEQTSGRINGRFAEPDWVPIRYLNKGFSRTTLAGFFRKAAVGLVTPIRDGMNLVAKEYVASQDRRDPGVLVLSSLAGAARELTEAVIVNPYDVDDVADGISIALSMSRDERRERHEAMLVTLRKNDITAWRKRFVEALLAD